MLAGGSMSSRFSRALRYRLAITFVENRSQARLRSNTLQIGSKSGGWAGGVGPGGDPGGFGKSDLELFSLHKSLQLFP